MLRLIRRLASSRSAVAAMAAAGFWAVLGAFWPGGHGGSWFYTWPFWLIAGALAAGLLFSLALRLPKVNSLRSLGSAVLHFSLILLAAGAFLSHRGARQTRIEIIEGQVQSIPGSRYFIRLDSLRPFYRTRGFLKGDAAEVTVFEKHRPIERAIIHANRPLEFAGYRIRLDLHGFAPFMDVNGNGSGESYSGFVSLKTSMGPGVYYWREIDFPDVALRASAVFRPSPDGPFPRAPKMKFVARDPNGGKLCVGQVSPGQVFKAGEYAVSFGEIRYWAAFQVRRDPGLPLIFAAFWLAVLGAAAALLPRLARG